MVYKILIYGIRLSMAKVGHIPMRFKKHNKMTLFLLIW